MEYGVTQTTHARKAWQGDHPPVLVAGTLVAGQNLEDAAVLGRITASGKVTRFDPAGGDGSETAVGVLMGATDAGAADEPCIVMVHGAPLKNELVWPAGITLEQQTAGEAQLFSAGLYLK